MICSFLPSQGSKFQYQRGRGGKYTGFPIRAAEFFYRNNREQSNSEGVNYPAGNTCPFGVDTSLLSPKRDKSSHIEDLRECVKGKSFASVFFFFFFGL
ncbi:hypothetical protein M752DRAFT_12545 [Aspergillus phoenicis ATCC 13157]|uniref:Uncharacterized protein n=1 Tax=Aspergillus phoenicis ATCC 13157 TaxID=1353007 RepID=A0A370Q1A6_ASPPH|nr:hypothetical protein M752DRAFT_12545 [Aspergillus phoenicis ATCC 13157]